MIRLFQTVPIFFVIFVNIFSNFPKEYHYQKKEYLVERHTVFFNFVTETSVPV